MDLEILKTIACEFECYAVRRKNLSEVTLPLLRGKSQSQPITVGIGCGDSTLTFETRIAVASA